MKTILIFILGLFNCIAIAQFSKAIPDFKNSAESKRFVERTDFKFGMELVRLDKNNKEILMRKLEYPLRFFKKEWNEKWQTNFSNYVGRITIPLEIYNPAKKEAAPKSAKVKGSQINYTLSVTPMQKRGDIYTCQLMYMVAINNISFKEFNGEKYPNETAENQSMNPIDIKVGEKVKIDLEGSFSTIWGIEDSVDGKPVTFNAKEDYHNYFNDYLIISLESEGTVESIKNVKKQKPKVVRGLISDKLTNKPVAGGMIMLLKNNIINALSVVDSSGLFIIDSVLTDKVTILSKRIGYKELITGPIPINNLDTLTMHIQLEQDAYIMNEIIVKEKRLNAWLKSRGFYERKSFGNGKFYGPEELKYNFASSIRDLVRVVPGLSFRDTGYGLGLFDGFNNIVTVWLDGFIMEDYFILESIAPSNVAAIEYYPRNSEVPMQFHRSYYNSNQMYSPPSPYSLNSRPPRFRGGGVLVIWTTQ